MQLKDFFQSTFRVATSIFLAVIALAIVGWIVAKANDIWTKQEAKQYEAIKLWPVDLKSNLQISLLAKTKLVDGRLLAAITIDGYPAYLSDPLVAAKNRDRGITLQFQDKDGFKVHSKSIQINEFSGVVDAKGAKSGLSYDFDEYMTPDSYARFTQLRVEWSLDTVVPASSSPVLASDSQVLDHCAPNLLRSERLKRLGQHGPVRQIGEGQYSVGFRELRFFGNELLSCQ